MLEGADNIKSRKCFMQNHLPTIGKLIIAYITVEGVQLQIKRMKGQQIQMLERLIGDESDKLLVHQS